VKKVELFADESADHFAAAAAMTAAHHGAVSENRAKLF
jgi:hypothetical protein